MTVSARTCGGSAHWSLVRQKHWGYIKLDLALRKVIHVDPRCGSRLQHDDCAAGDITWLIHVQHLVDQVYFPSDVGKMWDTESGRLDNPQVRLQSLSCSA